MVLQLGTILSFTSSWKSHKLRVSVFVEHASEVEEERKRIRALLDNLRIPSLASSLLLADQSVTTIAPLFMGAVLPPSKSTRLFAATRGGRRSRSCDATTNAVLAPPRCQTQVAGLVSGQSYSSWASQAAAGAGDATRKQSKREQSSSASVFQPSISPSTSRISRLGLAHPRARRDDGEDESSDSDSDFEDELAMLSEDDDWLVDGPQRRGLAIRRASTLEPASYSNKTRSYRPRAYSIGGSAGLPDDPVSKPLLGSSVSSQLTPGSVATSYGALSSSQRTANARNSTSCFERKLCKHCSELPTPRLILV